MIRSLTVLYDADCLTCTRLQVWLAAQVQLVPLTFVPAGSEAARRLFPALDHPRTLTEITVVGDDGSVFYKDKAMLMCLWALARWRGVALHGAARFRRPAVRLAASVVDRRRRWVKARHEAALPHAAAAGTWPAGDRHGPAPPGAYGWPHAGPPPAEAACDRCARR